MTKVSGSSKELFVEAYVVVVGLPFQLPSWIPSHMTLGIYWKSCDDTSGPFY